MKTIKTLKRYIYLIFGILLCILLILNKYIVYGVFALIICSIFNYFKRTVLIRIDETENQNKNLLKEISELKSSKLNVLDINEILEIGLLEVNTKLTRVWNQELNQDNKKLNFIGALEINLTAKLGLDLTKVKIEDEGNEIVISNTKPHFLSFSELQYNWRISELLEFKEPFIGSSYWRKTNDLFEQCTKIKEDYQKEVHNQIKNGPEELDWIINPLHEKIEKILTKKYGQSNKHIVFIDNKIIDRKSVENK